MFFNQSAHFLVAEMDGVSANLIDAKIFHSITSIVSFVQ